MHYLVVTHRGGKKVAAGGVADGRRRKTARQRRRDRGHFRSASHRFGWSVSGNNPWVGNSTGRLVG